MTALDGGVAVVTGATGGMGKVIALELASHGMNVVTVARDPQRAEALRGQIHQRTGREALTVLSGDISTRDGIATFADSICQRTDAVQVLVNNAGAHVPEHRLTPDGLEMHIAVDYLAAYGLTTLLEPQLRQGHARVVNVASDTLRDTRRITIIGPPRPVTLNPDHLDDLTLLNPATGFVAFEAYARAKLLTVLAGYDLAQTMMGDVTVNAVHPGLVATNIITDLVPRPLRPLTPLIRRTLLTPEQGATATLRLALDPALEGVTGQYFVRQTPTPTPTLTYNQDLQQRLRHSSDHFLTPR